MYLLAFVSQVSHEASSGGQDRSQGGQLCGTPAKREECQKQDQPRCDDDADRDGAIRHGVISKSRSQLTYRFQGVCRRLLHGGLG